MYYFKSMFDHQCLIALSIPALKNTYFEKTAWVDKLNLSRILYIFISL